MAIPNPIVERERRQGREGYVQYILASLIMGDKPPSWNKPVKPCDAGVRFLKKLDLHCFGGSDWSEPPDFYWEFRLKARTEGQENRWPDFAAVWPERIILFELKTEAGSIREGQVDEQIELGLYNYPNHKIDMIYITSDSIEGAPELTDRSSYANITWEEVAPFLTEVWNQPGPDSHDVTVVRLFADYLIETFQNRKKVGDSEKAQVSPIATADRIIDEPEEEPGDLDYWLNKALLTALAVEKNHKQAALDIPLESPKEAQRFRDKVKDVLRDYSKVSDQLILHAAPWIWQEQSGGSALTESGKRNGIELRFSYYAAGNRL